MSTPNAHSFEFTSIENEPIKLADLAGKVILIVNTASQCSFTPQYAELQKLHNTYATKGLAIIAVPSNNFGGQEFAAECDVANFTQKQYAITFPLTTITAVTGKTAHPFYRWATKQAGVNGSPKWNFHKYLINKQGDFGCWFATNTTPLSDKVIAAIEQELAK